MDERAYLKGFLEDYLRQKGLSTQKPFRCLSPTHEDKHPSMRYHKKGESVHCFSCGVRYDLFDLIGMDYGLEGFPAQLEKARELFAPGSCMNDLSGVSRTSISEAAAEAGQGGRVSTRRAGPGPTADKIKAFPPKKEMRSLRDESLKWGLGQSPIQTPPKAQENPHPSAYLEARGLTASICERFGVLEKEGRVWFPLYEEGRLVSHCGRALSDQTTPRYRNSVGSMGLWNADRIPALTEGETLCVTEGIIDALTLEQLGCPAVSLCGAQNQGKLLQALDKLPQGVRLLLCGDGDAAGAKMNETLSEALGKKGIACAILPLTAEDEDVSALFSRDAGRLGRLLADAEKERAEHGKDPDLGAAASSYAGSCAASALESFFLELERSRARGAPSSGFAGLDRLLGGGLYPGLYVLGAISSLGKTSLALQMADYIAGQEEDVLFFSLEQSRFELMAKSLSRICASMAGEGEAALTAHEILQGKGKGALLKDAAAAYAQGAGGLFLREGLGEIGAGEIRREVERHKALRGTAPVVVVDYLQILAPAETRATDKQNTDRAVTALKRLSRDFDIPVIAISSFNRENYKAAASMEAFKESGAVEYSADVLIGLQLAGAGGRDFDAAAEKLKNPRRLELILLKNRRGIPYAKLPLLYDARYSAFWEGKVPAATLPGLSVMG